MVLPVFCSGRVRGNPGLHKHCESVGKEKVKKENKEEFLDGGVGGGGGTKIQKMCRIMTK